MGNARVLHHARRNRPSTAPAPSPTPRSSISTGLFAGGKSQQPQTYPQQQAMEESSISTSQPFSHAGSNLGRTVHPPHHRLTNHQQQAATQRSSQLFFSATHRSMMVGTAIGIRHTSAKRSSSLGSARYGTSGPTVSRRPSTSASMTSAIDSPSHPLPSTATTLLEPTMTDPARAQLYAKQSDLITSLSRISAVSACESDISAAAGSGESIASLKCESAGIRSGQHGLSAVTASDDGAMNGPIAFPGLNARRSNGFDRRRDVVIHVVDETRNAQRDFFCKHQLLVREMKYFHDFINERSGGHTLDIDVHCDIEVFEWLMAYINRQRPGLEPRTAVSVLISSNFLQMEPLENICLTYIHDHLDEVVKVPIDLACISKGLISKLASMFTMEELEQVVDSKDKLKSKLFMHKIGDILGNPSSTLTRPPDRPPLPITHYVVPPSSSPSHAPTSSLHVDAAPSVSSPSSKPVIPARQPVVLRRCRWCHLIYPSDDEPLLSCDVPRGIIDFHGEPLARHEMDQSFDANDWAAGLVQGGYEWREVLWRIWGRLHHFRCRACGHLFLLGDIGRCRYHPEPLTFSDESPRGRYACCNEYDYRFSPFSASKGCRWGDHVPDDLSGNSYVFHLLRQHRTTVTGPSPQKPYAARGVTEQLENGVRCARIFGAWSEKIYSRREPLETQQLDSPPVGVFAVASLSPEPWPCRRIPQYLQREQDTDRMDSIAKVLVQFRV
ncbi:hypothetical protein DFJ73DRAFT_821670 [Zopfochytrium polystomum]|nr:hypothetical protein DFJ73DRAFT_821670 [Zopfochytrium polystomum]